MSKIQEVETLLKEKLKDEYEQFFHGEYSTPRNFRICIPCLIETQDYAIFQSEVHILDKVTLSAGKVNDFLIERGECHESKIKQEIRRTGKELTRKLGIINTTPSTSPEEKKKGDQECHIPDAMCGKCIDCNLWGFAASGGSESGKPSQIEVGTTYSIRHIDEIMRERNWNAIDENARRVLQAFGTKEQLQPQIFLPYVLELKDVNLDEFLYVLYSIYNASRIGAGSTKYGAVSIQPIGIYFAYESLFTNLELTKHMYDCIFNMRKDKLTDKAKTIGFLGDIKQSEAIDGMVYAINKELEDATCFYIPLDGIGENKEKTTFTELINKCKEIFRDKELMYGIIDRQNKTTDKKTA